MSDHFEELLREERDWRWTRKERLDALMDAGRFDELGSTAELAAFNDGFAEGIDWALRVLAKVQT